MCVCVCSVYCAVCEENALCVHCPQMYVVERVRQTLRVMSYCEHTYTHTSRLLNPLKGCSNVVVRSYFKEITRIQFIPSQVGAVVLVGI